MNDLRAKIETLRRDFDDACNAVTDGKALEELRLQFLSRKKGHLPSLLEDLKSLPLSDKPELGRRVNDFKAHVKDRIHTLEKGLQKGGEKAIRLDLTLPGKKRYLGSPHPLFQFQKEIESIFLRMGFTIEDGPEIETAY